MFYAEANRPKSKEMRFVDGFNASAVGFPNLMLPINCESKFMLNVYRINYINGSIKVREHFQNH